MRHAEWLAELAKEVDGHGVRQVTELADEVDGHARAMGCDLSRIYMLPEYCE